MKAIVTQGLGKVYDNGVQAVKDLTLEIEQGTIFGFLGPNGSGKTTTVRLLNGTLGPTGGRSTVLGLPPQDDQVRARTSTLAELARMYDQLSVLENLRFFAGLYGLSRASADAKIEELLTKLELWDKRGEKLGSFSTGMQKRVYLARVLVSNPEVIFLDEPTSGLDPDSGLQVTELIRDLAVERGTTIFLCTHNLPLAERICDIFGFMHEGTLVACGTKEELAGELISSKKVVITTTKGTHEHDLKRDEEINDKILEVIRAGESVTEVRIERPDLEALYFHYLSRRRKA